MAETKEKTRQTTVRLPLSLDKRIADEIHERKFTDRKTSFDAATKEAFELWLKAQSEQSSAITTECPRCHSTLRIEDPGSPELIAGPSRLDEDLAPASGLTAIEAMLLDFYRNPGDEDFEKSLAEMLAGLMKKRLDSRRRPSSNA